VKAEGKPALGEQASWITANLLTSTSLVSGESCKCSGLIKSPMLDSYMPQVRKRCEPSYDEEGGKEGREGGSEGGREDKKRQTDPGIELESIRSEREC